MSLLKLSVSTLVVSLALMTSGCATPYTEPTEGPVAELRVSAPENLHGSAWKTKEDDSRMYFFEVDEKGCRESAGQQVTGEEQFDRSFKVPAEREIGIALWRVVSLTSSAVCNPIFAVRFEEGQSYVLNADYKGTECRVEVRNLSSRRGVRIVPMTDRGFFACKQPDP